MRGDETDFHLPENISWLMLRQWFKTIYSKLQSFKECMGKDVNDIAHPPNFDTHNVATAEYINQLRKVQVEVDKAIKLDRGAFFEEDSIKLKKTNKHFVRFTPYGPGSRSPSDFGNGILPSEEAPSSQGINTAQSERGAAQGQDD